MANLHRLFIGINLPEKVKKDLFAFQDKWLDLPARWTWPENLHITLVFLGNATDQEIIDICKTAAEIAERHDPFDLTLDKIVYGPPNKEPRMVWATGPKSAELGALQIDLNNSFYETGINKEDENCENHEFAPHVTLARIKQFELHKMEQEEIPAVNEDIRHTFLVESVEIMESELKKGGPKYSVLESLRLGE
jgi:RNA 2',3'-cyclic 3'-phosphodiesterase